MTRAAFSSFSLFFALSRDRRLRRRRSSSSSLRRRSSFFLSSSSFSSSSSPEGGGEGSAFLLTGGRGDAELPRLGMAELGRVGVEEREAVAERTGGVDRPFGLVSLGWRSLGVRDCETEMIRIVNRESWRNFNGRYGGIFFRSSDTVRLR